MSNFLCPGSMVDHGWSWFSPFPYVSATFWDGMLSNSVSEKKKRKRKTPWGLHSFNTHTMRSLRRPMRTNLLNLWTDSIQGLFPSILLPQDSSFCQISEWFKKKHFAHFHPCFKLCPKDEQMDIKSSKTKIESIVITFIIDFWGGLQSWAMPKNMTSHPLSFQLLELWMMENLESKMSRIQWLQPSVIGNGTSLHQIQPEIAIPSQRVPLDLPVEPDRLPQQKDIKK